MSDCANGILYAEDFGLDLQVRRAPAASRPPAPPPAPPALTQADVDEACVLAVQAAQAAWTASAQERRAEALAILAARLDEVRQDAAQLAEAAADELARTVLSLVAGALPAYCRAHGDAEVRALVGRLAPLFGRAGRLVVRVHPGLAESLSQDLAAMDDEVAANVELRSANLAPGDLRLAWEDGALVRDTAAICAALRDGLAQFGLYEPIDIQTGSLTLAQ